MEQDKFIEILTPIIDGILRNENYISLEKSLLKANFNKALISSTYCWVYDKFSAKKTDNIGKVTNKGIRFINEEESEVIGVESVNRLLKLYNSGYLNSGDVDLIINEASSLPFPELNNQLLDIIMLTSVFNLPGSFHPGSRTHLLPIDRIN